LTAGRDVETIEKARRRTVEERAGAAEG